MGYVIGYHEYLKEHANMSPEMESLAKTLTQLIVSTAHDAGTTSEYINAQEIEITEPFLDVDFRFLLKKQPNLDLSNDSHFSKMKWQHLNLENNAYVLTGNVFMTDGNIPELEIVMAIDPNRESPTMYKKLYYKLLNTISHELNHLNQKGWNRDYDNVVPSSMNIRKLNGNGHGYFLLPEEIESMVKGMYHQSKAQNIPIDVLFTQHLQPFVDSGFMSQDKMIKIIEKWISHSLKYYPFAKMSNKYQHIIDNI